MHTLRIHDLHSAADGKEILHGVTLTVRSGEIHVIMGPNGSGKSTLCHVLMGHPHHKVSKGAATLDEQDLLVMTPDARAKAGLFLGFQYPREVPGVTFSNFLRQSVNAVHSAEPGYKPVAPVPFLKTVKEKMKLLEMPEDFLSRSVNAGFSGGEKKRAEIVQLAVLEPKFALLDETDSGLDIDALKIVARGVSEVAKATNMGVLLITHYQRILDYVKPNFVHVMAGGRLIKSGGPELAEQLEQEGYDGVLKDSNQMEI